MDPAAHILIVDDHRDIRDLLARYLSQNGYRVSTAEGSAAARRLLDKGAVELVVLDIMMPGEDGLALCRHLRATSELPVILLTAMAEETDRVIGLEMGADDYVTKPFNPRELLARIKAVLRRDQQPAARQAGDRLPSSSASIAGRSRSRSASWSARTASRRRSRPPSSSCWPRCCAIPRWC